MREQRQKEAVEAFLASDRRTIINAAPRFGKIKVALDICRELSINHIWILAPRKDIFIGWDDDMKKFGGPNIIGQTTFASIKNIDTAVTPLKPVPVIVIISLKAQTTSGATEVITGAGAPQAK